MSDPLHLAPLPHPRRDPYLGRARFLAAAFLSVSQALWFVAFIVAIQGGTPLTPLLSVLGLAGIFVIASRSAEAAELALAIVDRGAGLETAPSGLDLVRRFLVGTVIPFGILTAGFLGRGHALAIGLALGALLFMEILFRFGGVARWRGANIPFPALKALLAGSVGEAMDHLQKARDLQGRDLETSALAVASSAIREERADVLERLRDYLEERASGEAAAQRALAVIRADHARMLEAEDAALREAEALRLVPVGHPRRLSLVLFVATSALEEQDPESAAKALRLLHSRDTVVSTGRVVADWLLLKAAEMTQDDGLSLACRRALLTFDLRRAVRDIDTASLRRQDDPYARWICRAHDDLVRLSTARAELGA
jgi:hypothetical protein